MCRRMCEAGTSRSFTACHRCFQGVMRSMLECVNQPSGIKFSESHSESCFRCCICFIRGFRTIAAVGRTSLRERRTSTTPRSPVRRWTSARCRLRLLLLLLSRLWARPHRLTSAGPPVVLLQLLGSTSLPLTGPGPTPARAPVSAGPARSASRPPAASGRSTQSIFIRWAQQHLWRLRSLSDDVTHLKTLN